MQPAQAKDLIEQSVGKANSSASEAVSLTVSPEAVSPEGASESDPACPLGQQRRLRLTAPTRRLADPIPLPRAPATHWSLNSIPYDRINPEIVRKDEVLVYLAAAASFVETLASLYTRNLIASIHEDPEVIEWLSTRWESEELQHGAALRAYIQAAWPDFDWERAHAYFTEKYTPFCTADNLEPDEGLEMVARCVVEVGTATYYTAVARAAQEPVLRALCRRIAQDEVRHFAFFHAFFRRYSGRRSYPRWRVMGVLARRVLEVDSEDARTAAEAVRVGLPAGHALEAMTYPELKARATRLLRPTFPYNMAAHMLLKPVDLPAQISHKAEPLMARTAYLATRLSALKSLAMRN
jgi:hypothetical protein